MEAGGDEEVLSRPGVASCSLLLQGSLFCGTLLAGALALVLALSVPRCLFEHKPTVSSPQEEVDKAEELQKKSREFVRIVKEEPPEKWEEEVHRELGIEAEFQATVYQGILW